VLIGADVGDKRLPVLAQVPAGSPEHLPQRRLPLGGGARGLAGRLAVDLALQPQQSRDIPESHVGLAVQDALVSTPQGKACQVGGAGCGQPSRETRHPVGHVYPDPRRAAGAGRRQRQPGRPDADACLCQRPDCAADGVYEMFLVSAPLNAPGGIGSPANAVAIK
jgi:hypothetical protein